MALTAVMAWTKLNTRVATIAGRSSGNTTRNRVVAERPPSVSEASSRLLSICARDARPARVPTGMLRNTKQITRISPVPVISIGGTLNATM